MQMEGLAMTGAWVDREQGLVSIIALEMGGSSDLCAMLKPGEPVILMGPTGTPTEIEPNETVVLCGGGLGNAVLFSIGRRVPRRGQPSVLYFAGYKKLASTVYKVRRHRAPRQTTVIWCCRSRSRRASSSKRGAPQDRSFVGNIVEAMVAYDRGELGERLMPLATVDRIIAIGSDRMMSAVARARHGVLADHLKREHVGIGSINSPMQCMMKEVCAQCLQKWRDPVTGKETVVFTCFNQDQPLDAVDFENLAARLRLNSVQEKLTTAWLRKILET